MENNESNDTEKTSNTDLQNNLTILPGISPENHTLVFRLAMSGISTSGEAVDGDIGIVMTWDELKELSEQIQALLVNYTLGATQPPSGTQVN